MCVIGDLEWAILRRKSTLNILNENGLPYGYFNVLEMRRYVHHAKYMITCTFHSNEPKGGELNNKGIGEGLHRLRELIINFL